jgi:hypothetical protein
MWANWKDKSQSHRHYYIKELAQLADGDYVVPLRWVTANNVVHADAYDVDRVHSEQVTLFPLQRHQF